MSDTFNIEVEKVCPACSADCSGLDLQMGVMYVNGEPHYSSRHCVHRDMCRSIYQHILEEKKNEDHA